MINTRDQRLLQKAIRLALRSRQNGNHPFGALLAGSEGEILLEAENTVVTEKDCTGHAEINLMRQASKIFDPEYLAGCTLYSSTEPCAMCSGAIYWGGIGRVVFALSESQLREIIGTDSQILTLSLSCRKVFSQGKRIIQVEGPFNSEEAISVHLGFWKGKS